MNIDIRPYSAEYTADAVRIWNEVVEDGVAFPQLEMLDLITGDKFFCEQTFTGIAVDEQGEAVGLYILHPNNVGRCGHICNASYAVDRKMRGQKIGEKLVKDCISRAPQFGYKILQFNAVVATNVSALSLYKKLGLKQLGIIPGGFLMKDGHYEDIIPHYIEL